MTGGAVDGAGRDGARRKADALDLLGSESQLWLGTAAVGGIPHLIPVSFVWDGERITMGTAENSTTVRNLRRTAVARAAIGHHFDVVLIDGSVDFTSPEEIDTPTAEAFALVAHDPRYVPGYLYLRLTPRRVLAWRSFAERSGAQIMGGGRWLV
jgi:hypothetical protein